MGAAIAAIVLFALLLGASGARAAELVYWDNYTHASEPGSVSFANIDGSGGGRVNTSGVEFFFPEGMAYDPVSNRLFVAGEGAKEGSGGEIAAINLDGSGATAFSAVGAPIKEPEGIAVDPTTRMMYWANAKDDTIGWANLATGVGGTINTSGARTEGMYRLALDPVGGRVYWYGSKEIAPGEREEFIAFANVNNTGGGTLSAKVETLSGFATDPVTGRLYWQAEPEEEGFLYSVPLGGGTETKIPLGSSYNEGFGLAIDPVLNRAYWGNYGNEEVKTNAIGFNALTGGAPGGITTGAPVSGPQDPVIIKSPLGAGAPALTQSKAALSCSPGTWGPDYPGAYVYQSPRSFAYQWTLNGVPVGGATAPTLSATTPGAYACVVTATNQAGSTSQTSATAATVTKAKFKLVAKKKKAKAKPGKLATFKVQTSNGGDLGSKNAKLCLKVPKKAKKSLKAPKCATLKPIAAGKNKVSTLKVKVKPNAVPGSYKLTITLPSTKAAKVSLKVLG